MADTIKVMIVDDIAETREQLRKLLSFDPDIAVVAMAGSGEEAVSIVTDALPDVILMDINLPGMDGIQATAKIIEILPLVQIIMLSVQGETDYLRRAMMVGARDYLTKPPGSDELLDAIHRASVLRKKLGTGTLNPASVGLPASSQGQSGANREGKIITFYSPKGGTGCTTLAVNTALALQQSVGVNQKICLIDANLQFGDVSIFMKLQASRTMADLAIHADDLDTELLKTILVPHESGLSVLVAPPSPEDADVFRDGGVDEHGANERMKAILAFVRYQYDYVVIDTAHQVDDVLLAVMDLSDLLLLVTRPVIPEIRGARQFSQLFHKLNYDYGKLGLIVNSVDNKRMGIQPQAIERAMMPAIAQIPLDDRTCLRAANLGEPVMLRAAKTPIGLAFSELAEHCVAKLQLPVVAEVAEEPVKRAGLGRLL